MTIARTEAQKMRTAFILLVIAVNGCAALKCYQCITESCKSGECELNDSQAVCYKALVADGRGLSSEIRENKRIFLQETFNTLMVATCTIHERPFRLISALFGSSANSNGPRQKSAIATVTIAIALRIISYQARFPFRIPYFRSFRVQLPQSSPEF